MVVLGLDASTRAGSVALVDRGRVLGGIEAAGKLDHSERLLPSIEFLLDRVGLPLSAVEGIGVTAGPGSFTGVRVGLAAARGLARALKVPAAAVGTLEALAATAAPPPSGGWICAWLDAGRGEVYAAAYAPAGGGREERLPPEVAPPGRWLDRLPEVAAAFAGDGAEAYRDLLERRRGPGAVPEAGPWFLARATARLAEADLLRGGGRPLEPVYLRPPDAEVPRGGR